MKYLFLIFILSSMLVSLGTFAGTQQQDDIQKQIEQVMKTRDEMLKMLMDDSNFQDMNSRMEKLMKDFGSEDFFTGAEDDGDVVGEYEWHETKTHQILSLKVKQIKNRPLDIKIKGGKISMKGDVESQTAKKNKKTITRTHFEREFSIPEGVDETNPEFENKKGEFLIKFKKKIATIPAKKDLIPVVPNPDDQTI